MSADEGQVSRVNDRVIDFFWKSFQESGSHFWSPCSMAYDAFAYFEEKPSLSPSKSRMKFVSALGLPPRPQED